MLPACYAHLTRETLGLLEADPVPAVPGLSLAGLRLCLRLPLRLFLELTLVLTSGLLVPAAAGVSLGLLVMLELLSNSILVVVCAIWKFEHCACGGSRR